MIGVITMTNIEKFVAMVKNSDNIVFFGGAGVSTESGIPDFRSTDGLYNIINGFFSDAIMKGVTDESWNSYLADLENYGYNYYVDFYNKLAHNEL